MPDINSIFHKKRTFFEEREHCKGKSMVVSVDGYYYEYVVSAFSSVSSTPLMKNILFSPILIYFIAIAKCFLLFLL